MPKKSAKNKTVLPDPLPKGEVLIDIAKKKWVLGPSIGVGGFGEIYSAAQEGSKNYQYVVKIEPHGNGPLFCEMHFFMRNSKPDMLQAWCTQKKIPSLGMPRYLGSGSHEHKGKKYRFLVMDKYGKDLWHIFLENDRKFPSATVYRIAIQLLDVLEYIHSNGYIHADIKGANILTGLTKATESQVFLVDFGLASHYTKKEYKADPRKAHNGTIEYTSRDAHEGIPTRRGDLEILAYNMVHWMGCVLPWEDLSDPVLVHKSKKENMLDIMRFTKLCFGNLSSVPAALIEFLDYIKNMQYDTEPDYKFIRKLFQSGLESSDGRGTGALEFTATKHKSDEATSGAIPKKRAKLTPNKNSLDEVKTKGRRRLQKKEQSSPPTNGVEDDEPVQVGYNAEMLRLQKKIADRNTSKRGTKPVTNSSKVDAPVLEEDVIEDTPPKPVRKRAKTLRDRKIKEKHENESDEEVKVTSRSLRQRKQRSYVDTADTDTN